MKGWRKCKHHLIYFLNGAQQLPYYIRIVNYLVCHEAADSVEKPEDV